MKNTTRRVNMLKNVNSKIIEQAILLLKGSAPEGDSQVLREAEKIVEKYMGKKRQKEKEEKKVHPAILLSIAAITVSVGVMIMVFFV